MIRLFAGENDDPTFLLMVDRIVNGAITALQAQEVFLVHVDNWFDHKWLGWRSHWSHGEIDNLRLPLFTPNRIRSEKHFVRNMETSAWEAADLPKPLHIRRSGRSGLALPVDQFSRSAAFIWYSGNTTTNTVGSLMFYLSGADNYAWYASLKKDSGWIVADEFHVTRRELLAFEERGFQMQAAEAQGLAGASESGQHPVCASGVHPAANPSMP